MSVFFAPRGARFGGDVAPASPDRSSQRSGGTEIVDDSPEHEDAWWASLRDEDRDYLIRLANAEESAESQRRYQPSVQLIRSSGSRVDYGALYQAHRETIKRKAREEAGLPPPERASTPDLDSDHTTDGKGGAGVAHGQGLRSDATSRLAATSS
jgi:hypothetical protein